MPCSHCLVRVQQQLLSLVLTHRRNAFSPRFLSLFLFFLSSLWAGVCLSGCICPHPWLCVCHTLECTRGTFEMFQCLWSVQADPVQCWGSLQLCTSQTRELLTPVLWIRQKSGSYHVLEPWCHFGSWQILKKAFHFVLDTFAQVWMTKCQNLILIGIFFWLHCLFLRCVLSQV